MLLNLSFILHFRYIILLYSFFIHDQKIYCLSELLLHIIRKTIFIRYIFPIWMIFTTNIYIRWNSIYYDHHMYLFAISIVSFWMTTLLILLYFFKRKEVKKRHSTYSLNSKIYITAIGLKLVGSLHIVFFFHLFFFLLESVLMSVLIIIFCNHSHNNITNTLNIFSSWSKRSLYYKFSLLLFISQVPTQYERNNRYNKFIVIPNCLWLILTYSIKFFWRRILVRSLVKNSFLSYIL